MNIIGAPINRTDGLRKVSGTAKYSAEHEVPGVVHAVMVTSTIPKGRITRIDAGGSEQVPGVLLIMTHENALQLPEKTKSGILAQPNGRIMSLLQYDVVHYNNEPIAVVVADTLEHARDAAARLRVDYAREAAVLDFQQARQSPHPPEKVLVHPTDSRRGNLQAGLLSSTAQLDQTYTTPIENHNPIEPHATIAQWNGDRLVLHDSTQNITGVKSNVAGTFGIPPENVTVLCPYVGGGFGCKGSLWSHVVLTAMAAKQVGRPVKLVLDRNQMFGPVGQRPMTDQHMRLAALSDGRIMASSHDAVAYTSMLEDWIEPCALVTRMLYQSPNQETTHRLARLNLGTPTFMRAPGESTGSFALESAMDELAVTLGMDPLQLRLKNYAEINPDSQLPWSSKSLRQCYEIGAEKFGWSSRDPQPRSMRDGNALIGWGMATASYPANRLPAGAAASMLPDGSVIVRSGTHELGTGTYTVMTQVAADALGVPIDMVTFELGDTRFPEAPGSGGSRTVASVAPAVHAACEALRLKLTGMAIADERSCLYGAVDVDVGAAGDGFLFLLRDPAQRESMAQIVARQGGGAIEAAAETAPGEESQQYSMHSFGAVFVEVRVDEDLGVIRVPRVVGVYGVGKLMNQKTGYSQLMGGVVWGIGMALLEETMIDPREGRAVNGSLAEYHVPANADVGSIDVSVVDEDDPYVNSMGAKGIGEIGITGVAPAIANAVFHATGRRVRDLPITLDKLL